MNTLATTQLPNRRWLTRAMVIEYVGTRRELERLERAGRLVPEFPGGIKHKRYVRSQVLACIKE
jgi:hypothetical protein